MMYCYYCTRHGGRTISKCPETSSIKHDVCKVLDDNYARVYVSAAICIMVVPTTVNRSKCRSRAVQGYTQIMAKPISRMLRCT